MALFSSGTGADKIATGTTGQQPVGTKGMIRYNTTEDCLEVYTGTDWVCTGSTSVHIGTPSSLSGIAPHDEGDLWYNTDDGMLYIYYTDANSSQWVDCSPGGGGGGASVEVSPTPPSSPNEGDLWFNPNDGMLYIYYTDVNSSQWINCSPPGSGGGGASVEVSPTPPGSPNEGDLWYNTVDGMLYVYYTDANSSQWVDASPSGSGGGGSGTPPTPDVLPPDLTLTTANYEDGVYVCNNLNIPAGVVATTHNYNFTVICYGNATINGSIVADGSGGYGSAGVEVLSAANESMRGFGPGSGTTYRGVSPLTSSPYSPLIAAYGSGGTGGGAKQVSAGQTAAGNGGNGGGGIIIRAYGTITMGSGAKLSADGTDGFGGQIFSGTGAFSGGGGGSGGCIILHANGNITTNGILSVKGGSGSRGADNMGGSAGGAGGCGGGGGYIILQTGGTLVESATKQLQGGTGGPTYGSSAGKIGSSCGPSFGGVGGAQNYTNPGAGQPGKVAYSGSPIA